jgi:aspartate/methionine/tyrosine aminotransferase
VTVEPRRLPPASGIRAFFDRAAELERAGRSVVRLDVGRPVWHLPPGAEDAAVAALHGGENHYTANRGLLELREALAATLPVAFEPETELVVTAGASEAIALAAFAFTGAGDEVIVPQPAWSHYEAIFAMAGATVVPLPLDPAGGFLIDPDALEAALTGRTRVVVVNSPSNPTGAVQPDAVMQRVAAMARSRGLMVLSDDVYSELAFTAAHAPVARHLDGYDGLLQIGSLSKSDAMTGWRIGWVAAAAPVADALNRVHQYLTVCATSVAQRGAVAALTHPGRADHLTTMRAAFAEKLALWRGALPSLPGVSLPSPPDGAIYVFPRIERDGMSGRELCDWLLDEHGLAIVPGDVFGRGYEQHVRISFGGPLEDQREAIERLGRALAG